MHIYVFALLCCSAVVFTHVVRSIIKTRLGTKSFTVIAIDRLDQIFFTLFSLSFAVALLDYGITWLLGDQASIGTLFVAMSLKLSLMSAVELVLPNLWTALEALGILYILVTMFDLISARVQNAHPLFIDVHKWLATAAPIVALLVSAVFLLGAYGPTGSLQAQMSDAKHAVNRIENAVRSLAITSLATSSDEEKTLTQLTQNTPTPAAIFPTPADQLSYNDPEAIQIIEQKRRAYAERIDQVLNAEGTGEPVKAPLYFQCYRSASTSELNNLADYMDSIPPLYSATETAADQVGASQIDARYTPSTKAIGSFSANTLDTRMDSLRRTISSAFDIGLDMKTSLNTALPNITPLIKIEPLNAPAEPNVMAANRITGLDNSVAVYRESKSDRVFQGEIVAGGQTFKTSETTDAASPNTAMIHEIAMPRGSLTGLTAQEDQRIMQGCEPFPF